MYSLNQEVYKMKYYIGVDIGKLELDVFDGASHFKYSNTEKGIKQFIKEIKKSKLNKLVAFEATGGYEKNFSELLSASSINFRRVHPNKVRHYGKALGYLAKTDKIDAKLIRMFAENQNLEGTDKLLDEKTAELKDLLGRREQLLNDKIRENNRLDKYPSRSIASSIKKHIKWIDEELKNLEKEIKAITNANENLKEKINLYKSISGIGQLSAAYLATHLPELGEIENKSLAALTGVAPMNKDSGKKSGKRTTQAGRAAIRRVLYMASLSAIRFNKDIKIFYDRLIKKNKLFKVAITAVMRKLIIIVNSVAKRGTPWQADKISS